MYIGAKRQPEYYNQIIAQKPKVEKLIQEEFPQLKQAYVKSDVLPDIAGRHHVFAAPVIHVFYEGLETIRNIRNIGIDELRRAISRLYSMIFSA